jgi:serine/threonine-protein kinase
VAAVKWAHGPALRLPEGALLRAVDHPGLPAWLGEGTAGGRPWLAMRCIDGLDLRTYAEKLRARPERLERVRSIAREVGEALVALHASGMVHRDVKPGNILLTPAGGAVLVDLGSAAPPGARGGGVGTPGWLAPEQLRGGMLDARADQYGFGASIYLLATGRAPFGVGPEALRAQAEGPPRPPSQLDPTLDHALDTWILRLLARAPADRYPDMAAALDALPGATAPSFSLAGREAAIRQLVAILDRVASGQGEILRATGSAGSGRGWFLALAEDAATRRGIPVCLAEDEEALAGAALRIARGEALLALTRLPWPEAHAVDLPPLSVAELRRTLFPLVPGPGELAEVAERVHRLTGGNAELIRSLLERYASAGRLVLPDPPALDVEAWLQGLDMDEEAVATALAFSPGARDEAAIEALAQTPCAEILPMLEGRGLVTRHGRRWRLSADLFRDALLARVPDPSTWEARLAAGVTEDDPLLAHAAALPIEEGARVLLAADATPARQALLGKLRWLAGDVEGARGAWEACRAGGPREQARGAIGLGILATQAGDQREALARFREALAAAERAGNGRLQALAEINIAEACSLTGNVDLARAAAERSLALATGEGARDLEAAALRHLGLALLDAGEPGPAEVQLAEAAAIARALNLPDERLAAQTLRARAALDREPRERAAATAALDRLLPLLRETDPDPEGFRTWAWGLVARAAAVLGDRRMAAESARAVEGARSARPAMGWRARLELARAAALSGDEAEAARIADAVAREAGAAGADLFARSARVGDRSPS